VTDKAAQQPQRGADAVAEAQTARGVAAALLVTRRLKPERVYRQVDWDLLVLFVGLFVVVAGARHADRAYPSRLRRCLLRRRPTGLRRRGQDAAARYKPIGKTVKLDTL
jgi:hypothetical protein